MYYLGLDIGSSSIKAALVEIATGKSIGVVQEPKEEMGMFAQKNGWAEQSPLDWWRYVCSGIDKLCTQEKIEKSDISGIGISYQMHGLVLIDKEGNPLRKSIIWCDSRAVGIGQHAYEQMGPNTCNSHLLNSPSNFTASKLKWVKENEPELFDQIDKFLLPGDYLNYKLSGLNCLCPDDLIDAHKKGTSPTKTFTEEEFEALKQREKNYSQITIDASNTDISLDSNIVAFMTTNKEKLAKKGDENCFIPAKYVDILTSSFSSYPDIFVKEYKKCLEDFPFALKEGTYTFSDPIQNKFAKEGLSSK